jgi:hypothetical protein
MDGYNAVSRDVCRSVDVECVDAAAALPQDTTVFYDDVHFNVSGSHALAALLHRFFASRPPFVQRTAPAVP